MIRLEYLVPSETGAEELDPIMINFADMNQPGVSPISVALALKQFIISKQLDTTSINEIIKMFSHADVY